MRDAKMVSRCIRNLLVPVAWDDRFGVRRQSEAATALFLRLGPVPKRRRALLAAAVQNVTDNLAMHRW